MTKKTVLVLVKTVLPLLLGLYLFWHFFSSMSEEHVQSFKKAVQEADYTWIALSLVIAFVALYARAARWKYMLEPLGYKTPYWNRYHAMMIGYLINFTIPRAGEPSRAAMLYRSDGVPFSKSFGTIIGERAFDVIMLGVVTGITMLIGYEDLMEIFDRISDMGGEEQQSGFGLKQVIYLILGLLVVGGIAVVIISKKFREKLVGFIRDVLKGALSVFKTKNPGGFILYTLLIWVSYILMFIIPFYSLKETADFPVSGYFIGFVAGSVGISLTNGGIGVYPWLVGMVVAFYLSRGGTPEQDAEGIGKALGMLVWLGQTIFMVVLGLISLVLLPKNYEKENVKTSVSE